MFASYALIAAGVIDLMDKERDNRDATRLVMPVTLALGAGWAIAALVYGAGSKVGSSEKDIAYLTSRIDTMERTVKDEAGMISKQSEDNIELRTKLTSLREYIDSVEASKNISISMEPPDKKRR